MQKPRNTLRLITADAQPANLSSNDARAIVREIAQDSARIALVLGHAKMRATQRGISLEDIQRVLLRGVVTEGPYIAAKSGWWRLNVTGQSAGAQITSVVEIEWATRLLVVTVMK